MLINLIKLLQFCNKSEHGSVDPAEADVDEQLIVTTADQQQQVTRKCETPLEYRKI